MDWDSYETREHDEDLDKQAERFLALSEAKKRLEEELDLLAATLAANVPEDPGDHGLDTKNYVVTVRRSERWEWDSEALASMFVTTALPSYVRTKYMIAKRDFKRLPEAEQKELIRALTRRPGSARITVARKS